MQPARDRCKILIVDKENKYRQMLFLMLISLGFRHQNISQAADGGKAWEILDSLKTDLIFSGWVMPVKSGLDLLKAVRADERLSSLPFVMATARSSQADILLAAKEKVSLYLVKPFSENLLDEKLKSIGFK